MNDFILNLNIIIASTLLITLVILSFNLLIRKSKKNIILLLLIVTVFLIKIIYSINTNNLEYKDNEIFYMFLITDIIILLVFVLLSKEEQFHFIDKIIMVLDYITCIMSFYFTYNHMFEQVNNIVIIGLIVLNICYFYRRCPLIIQVLTACYIVSFICILQTNENKIAMFINLVVDCLFSLMIFFKIYEVYINKPKNKYLKTKSNLNRSFINIKLYEEQLNNYKKINKSLNENYNEKEKNLRTILGQFKKSALLIDKENYIVNNDDVVFYTMFNKYAPNEKEIKIEDFLDDYIEEREKFLQILEEVRHYSRNVVIQMKGKDNRVFECVFSLYEENDLSNIVCILSDITYEKKISLKTQENDIKYKKIIENIPYTIILEKNNKVIYNNNKLDIDLNDEIAKNMILNNSIKGNVSYIDKNNKENHLYIDRIKFVENEEEISLIEIKEMSKYKRLLEQLEVSTNEYKTLIDTIPEAICVLDYETKKFEYANNTFFELFKVQDIENMDLDEIYNDITISSGNINENIKYMRKTLKDGCGGLINIESSVVPIYVNKSNKMVLIIRDITKELKVEDMRKEIEESENMIKDRDDFFINMSHELLTPANLLHTSNQFIERSCRDIINREPKGEFANCIFVIKKQVEIITTLIDKMMELSKLEVNYNNNTKGVYDIVSLCEDVVTEINKYTLYKNINILFDTDEEEVYTYINPNDITKAILTLLSVVVKYSRIKSTINFNIKVKGKKVIVMIENFKRYNYEHHLENYEEKILTLSMSIAKLIVNMYKGKINMKMNKEDCMRISVEFDIEENVNEEDKLIKTIDEDFIYREYKKICDL